MKEVVDDSTRVLPVEVWVVLVYDVSVVLPVEVLVVDRLYVLLLGSPLGLSK